MRLLIMLCVCITGALIAQSPFDAEHQAQWKQITQERAALEEEIRRLTSKASKAEAYDLERFMELLRVGSSLEEQLRKLHAQAVSEKAFVEQLTNKNSELYYKLQDLLKQSGKEQANLFEDALSLQTQKEDILRQLSKAQQENLPTAELSEQLKKIDQNQAALNERLVILDGKSLPENQQVIKSFRSALQERDKVFRELVERENQLMDQQTSLMEKLRDVEQERAGLLKELDRVKSQGGTQEMLMVDRIVGAMKEREALSDERDFLKQHLSDAEKSIKKLTNQNTVLKKKIQDAASTGAAEYTKLIDTIGQLETQLASDRESLIKASADQKEQLLQHITKLERERLNAFELLRRARANATTSDKIMLDNIQGLLRERESIMQQLSFSGEERERLEKNLQEIQKAHEDLEREFKTTVAELSQRNAEHAQLLSRIETLEQEKLKTKDEVAKLRDHLNVPEGGSLLEQFNQLNKERTDLRDQLQMLASAYQLETGSLLQRVLDVEQNRDKLSAELDRVKSTGQISSTPGEERIPGSFAQIEYQLTNLETRVSALEKLLNSVTGQLQTIDNKLGQGQGSTTQITGKSTDQIWREEHGRADGKVTTGKSDGSKDGSSKPPHADGTTVPGASTTQASWWLIAPSELKRHVDGAIEQAEQLLHNPTPDPASVKKIRKQLEESWLDYEMAQDPEEPRNFRAEVLSLIKGLTTLLQPA